ncbi:MAG: hypothetical protein JXK07_07225 [Spirochaetes bacterium]|nr:hypothetical protein [Spirochaetota bacterium]MBN2769645.1 hypothetical protein [Spirochaetota bacterium]
MNITADGILGSARKINQKRTSLSETSGPKSTAGKSDSVQIETRLNGRLDTLQADLKATQTSLTRNQIIHAGLKDLTEDFRKGGGRSAEIVSQVTYNGEQPLRELIGDNKLNEKFLDELMKGTVIRINKDIADLSRMQVESENIFASSLISDPSSRMTDMFQNNVSGESISSLNADVVMRLTR